MTIANHNSKTVKVESFGPITKEKARHAQMSIFDKNGKVLVRWGTPEVTAPGKFATPQGLALNS